jgi:hypothetical protein
MELPVKKPVSIPCTGKDGSCSMAEFIELTNKKLADEEWRRDCPLDSP